MSQVLADTSVLDTLGVPQFKPLPWISSGKSQTLMGHYLPFNPFLSDRKQHIITLPDHDKIVLIENTALQRTKSQRIILLVHGLTGSHLSRYLIRITRLLVGKGFLVMRMNLRGCGAGTNLAQNLYHSGRSEDTRAVLNWLKMHFPQSPVTQIGFSLGANITLKMAGEDGTSASSNVDSIIAVSPPLDLLASVKNITQSIFDQHFVKALLQDVRGIHQTFPDLPKTTFPRNLTLYDFDNLYTAPRSGFIDAYDYYTQCSSGQFVEHITLPTLILHAMDDPLVAHHPFTLLPKKKNLHLLLTKEGGHLGWLASTGKLYPYRWMDQVIVNWVMRFDQHA